MEGERLGLVGGLAADRPVLVATVLAFGASALAAVGVNDAREAGIGSSDLADLLLTFLVLPVLPLMLAAIAPRKLAGRLAFVAGVALALLAVDAAAPSLQLDWLAPDRRLLAAAFILTLVLVLIAPACGAYARLAFIGAAAAVLGAAGVAGALRYEGIPLDQIGLATALGVALGVVVTVGIAADHAALFARGADKRRAAGLAARQAGAPALFAVTVCAAAFPVRAQNAPLGGETLDLVWVSGLAGAVSILCALFIMAGALSLHRVTETLAVEENARTQTQRRFWRPLRNILPTRSAFAAIAIIGIILVIAAFELALAPAWRDIAFVGVLSGGAALIFFSLRAGLFVFATLVTASVLSLWVARLIGVAIPEAPMDTAGLALAGVVFGQFALAWREARSPRLNARETMEAAMTDGTGRYLISLSSGAAALYAAGVSGAAPQASSAAGYALCLGLIGALMAPVLMTALSGLTGRDQF